MTRFISHINKYRLLSISIGIIYLWFGALKFFPELSPADALAKQTITFLTVGFLPEKVSILMLALIEVTIGAFLICNFQIKKVVIAAILHLMFTFIPVLFFPETSFAKAPFVLTLVGQYIIKNIVIISALLFIYPLEEYKREAF
ncbi:doxx family protein [Snuella sedimenti]|uniref:Doxx family protein n=1 Tax=Snuella sedimenti TaxID=2798802 RepID=A0A8J7J6F9_9FLAO|nr:doxx family protein [Snuella sedimenti]MBJ6369314.1 doxx family protein [Snuella sedimenti]